MKASQPMPQVEIGACFAVAKPDSVEKHIDHDKGHGRIKQHTVSVSREVAWRSGMRSRRRFPGKPRLLDAACIARVNVRT